MLLSATDGVVMHFLLIGYMFLFIDRPFEVWPWLGDLRIERVYMLFTLGVWAIYPYKRWLPNPQHAAYGLFALAVGLCWLLSPWMTTSQPKVEDWFKVLVFYLLLVTTVHDEKGLQRMAIGFLAVMGLYLMHSFREYLGGRHTYRMGIARMVGVDTSLGDPNSFGASIVFALPLVTAVWRSGFGGTGMKLALCGYTGLSVLCVLLTGSRSSLLGLLVWIGIVILGHRKRWLWLTLFVGLAPVIFVALPASLQTRFQTIINPEVGPENARISGEGRIHGLMMGLDLWSNNPITGVGPGAWKPATGQELESHSLYGQLLGEMGTVGVVAFLAILGCFAWNARRVRTVRNAYPEWRNDLVSQLPAAVAVTVFLLLFMGLFGHNLFRHNWLWYGGFLIVARHCLERRLLEVEEYDFPEWTDSLDEAEPNPEWAAEPIPVGWTRHDRHG
jgi:O-antigen ligase